MVLEDACNLTTVLTGHARFTNGRNTMLVCQQGVGLPFVRIQGTTVEWDELRFDVRLLQRVPYGELPDRIVTAFSIIHKRVL